MHFVCTLCAPLCAPCVQLWPTPSALTVHARCNNCAHTVLALYYAPCALWTHYALRVLSLCWSWSPHCGELGDLFHWSVDNGQALGRFFALAPMATKVANEGSLSPHCALLSDPGCTPCTLFVNSVCTLNPLCALVVYSLCPRCALVCTRCALSAHHVHYACARAMCI